MSTVKAWNDTGLRFIADLYCKETGEQHNCSTLRTLFNINMTFLCHASLMRSIVCHNEIRSSVAETVYPILPYKIALMARNSNISRIAYREFICALGKQRQCPGHIEQKWRRDIGCMHEGTMYDIRRSTKNTYLQAFHYRIVSRIISTNTFLYRIGKSQSSLCTFCKTNQETLYHVLWDCTFVQIYVKAIAAYLKDKCNVKLTLKSQSWFFPRIEEESQINILIITIAKLVIFKSKYKEARPNIQHFISLIKLEAQKDESK